MPDLADTARASFLRGLKLAERQSDGSLRDATPQGPGKAATRYVVPHVQTFSGLFSTYARTYINADEATKDSLENARVMRNDCGVMECVEARQRATALLGWHLEPEDEKSARQKDLCDLLTRLIKRIGRFTELRMWLMGAVWFGKSAAQFRYRPIVLDGRKYWTPLRVRDNPGWRPIHGDKLVWRYEQYPGDPQADQLGIRIGTRYAIAAAMDQRLAGPEQAQMLDGRWKVEPTERGMAYFLDPQERDRVAVHKHMIEDGEYEDPRAGNRLHGVGIRSRIYWDWVQKQETLAFLMEFLERSAGGIQVWTYPDGNDGALKKAQEAAKEVQGGGKNVVFFPKPMGDDAGQYDIQIIEPGMAGVETLHSLLGEYFGHRIKRYILGQTLSTEAGSTGMGSGVAELHLDSFLQIVEYDSNNLDETMTYEVVDFLKRVNVPEAADVHVRFVSETEAQDNDKRLDACKSAWDMGTRLKERDILDLIGFNSPGPDDRVLVNESAGKAPPAGGMPGMGGPPDEDGPDGGEGAPEPMDGPDHGPERNEAEAFAAGDQYAAKVAAGAKSFDFDESAVSRDKIGRFADHAGLPSDPAPTPAAASGGWSLRQEPARKRTQSARVDNTPEEPHESPLDKFVVRQAPTLPGQAALFGDDAEAMDLPERPAEWKAKFGDLFRQKVAARYSLVLTGRMAERYVVGTRAERAALYAKGKPAKGQGEFRGITLNGGSGDGGHGGTPVLIDGKGNIKGGPAAPEGHNLDSLPSKKKGGEAKDGGPDAAPSKAKDGEAPSAAKKPKAAKPAAPKADEPEDAKAKQAGEPDQPRDEHGRWTGEGGSGPPKPAAPKGRLSAGTVRGGIDEIRNVVGFARNGPANEKRAVYYGTVDEDLGRRIKDATGIDVTGLDLVMDSFAVRHSLKRHGDEAERLHGQEPLTDADFENVPEAVTSFDAVDKDPTDKDPETLRFYKRVSGHLIVITAARRGRGELAVKSIRKGKAKRGADRANYSRPKAGQALNAQGDGWDPASPVTVSTDARRREEAARYEAGSSGHWVTIHGTPVFIDGDGKASKGPAALVGKSFGERPSLQEHRDSLAKTVLEGKTHAERSAARKELAGVDAKLAETPAKDGPEEDHDERPHFDEWQGDRDEPAGDEQEQRPALKPLPGWAEHRRGQPPEPKRDPDEPFHPDDASPQPAKLPGAAKPLQPLSTGGGNYVGAALMHYSQLKTDPSRFQYKFQGVGEGGVTDELKGVRQFSPMLGGQVLAWHDPADGQAYVVNGHHRHELADRSGEHEGWDGSLSTYFVNAKDAKEARALGALANIAEGRGTSVDAAKFLRDTGMDAGSLYEKHGISIKGATARDAGTLTRLSDSLFDKLATGRIETSRALAIASELSDHDKQAELLKEITRTEEKRGKALPDSAVKEMAKMMDLSKTTKDEGGGLFGDFFEKSSFAERGELMAMLRRQFTGEHKVFREASSERRRGALESTGTNRLDVEGNRDRAKAAGVALWDFDTSANARGNPVAKAITEAAEELANAPRQRKRIEKRLAETVRGILGGSADAGAAGPAGGDAAGHAGSGSDRERAGAADRHARGFGGRLASRLTRYMREGVARRYGSVNPRRG